MPRTAIGVDAVAITPVGKTGLDHLIVVVNLFTKLTALYPVHGCSAKNLSHTQSGSTGAPMVILT
jgi:hypothetical protein